MWLLARSGGEPDGLIASESDRFRRQRFGKLLDMLGDQFFNMFLRGLIGEGPDHPRRHGKGKADQ